MSLTDAVKLAAIRNPSLTEAVKDAARDDTGAVVRFPQQRYDGRGHDGCDEPATDRRASIAFLLGIDDGSGRAFAIEPGPGVRHAGAAYRRRPRPDTILIHRSPPAGQRGLRRVAVGAKLAAIALLLVLVHLLGATGTGSEAQVRGGAVQPKRVALVIGNALYQHTAKLENPRNDALDVSAALRKVGFHVVEGFDLDKAAFDRKIREFAVALQGAEVGLFFYAGHGLQVSGHNYLVPIDAQLTTVTALDFEMVRLDLVHRTMEREAETNILFFDACRDNPLSRNLARAMGTRSAEIGRGLAAVESGVGTLISFSTQPGNVALDGKGRNSPFARALLKQIGASTDDLSAILIAVRNDVVKTTDRKQVPWEHSALTGRFYFKPAPKVTAAAPGAQLVLSEAAEAWSATRDTASITVLDAFVARFGDTFYAELARARIEELKKQDAPRW